MTRFLSLRGWLTGAALTLALAAGVAEAQSRRAAPAPRVTVTAAGHHLLGNPAARVRLVEWVSYTCPHCAHFDRDSQAILRTAYVARGTTAVEVRSLVRDPVDLASALLAQCGAPSGFFRRHHAIMAAQEQTFAAITPAVQQGWSSVTGTARLQRIAADTGLTALMAPLGVTPAAAQRCLSDEAAIRQLEAKTEAAIAEGVQGTPSFAINGTLLANVHSWQSLQPRLDAAVAAPR